MATTDRCTCGNRSAWRVWVRCGNYSAFNGYRRAYSDYSQVCCETEHGGCGRQWRTKAAYVATLPDSETWGEARMQKQPTGQRGHQGPTTFTGPSDPANRSAPMVCEVCGKPGDMLKGPLTAAFRAALKRDKVFHRDVEACRGY